VYRNVPLKTKEKEQKKGDGGNLASLLSQSVANNQSLKKPWHKLTVWKKLKWYSLIFPNYFVLSSF